MTGLREREDFISTSILNLSHDKIHVKLRGPHCLILANPFLANPFSCCVVVGVVVVGVVVVVVVVEVVEVVVVGVGVAHDSPRTPDVYISRTRRFKTPPKFHEKIPKRGKIERKLWRERKKKKERNFGRSGGGRSFLRRAVLPGKGGVLWRGRSFLGRAVFLWRGRSFLGKGVVGVG